MLLHKWISCLCMLHIGDGLAEYQGWQGHRPDERPWLRTWGFGSQQSHRASVQAAGGRDAPQSILWFCSCQECHGTSFIQLLASLLLFAKQICPSVAAGKSGNYAQVKNLTFHPKMHSTMTRASEVPEQITHQTKLREQVNHLTPIQTDEGYPHTWKMHQKSSLRLSQGTSGFVQRYLKLFHNCLLMPNLKDI